MNLKVWNILALVALVFVINATATDDAKEKQLHVIIISAIAIRDDNFHKFGNRFGYNLVLKRLDEKRISDAGNAYTDYLISRKPAPVPVVLATRPPMKPTSKPVPITHLPVPKPTVKPVVIHTTTTTTTTTTPAPTTVTQEVPNSEDNPVTTVEPLAE